MVFRLSSWLDRFWLIYYRCLSNDKTSVRVLPPKDGSCKQGDSTSKGSASAYWLLTLDDGKLRQIYKQERVYLGRTHQRVLL